MCLRKALFAACVRCGEGPRQRHCLFGQRSKTAALGQRRDVAQMVACSACIGSVVFTQKRQPTTRFDFAWVKEVDSKSIGPRYRIFFVNSVCAFRMVVRIRGFHRKETGLISARACRPPHTREVTSSILVSSTFCLVHPRHKTQKRQKMNSHPGPMLIFPDLRGIKVPNAWGAAQMVEYQYRVRQKRVYSGRGLNSRPSACKADVITTRLPELPSAQTKLKQITEHR